MPAITVECPEYIDSIRQDGRGLSLMPSHSVANCRTAWLIQEPAATPRAQARRQRPIQVACPAPTAIAVAVMGAA